MFTDVAHVTPISTVPWLIVDKVTSNDKSMMSLLTRPVSPADLQAAMADIEDLELAGLSEAELLELGELIDPDVSGCTYNNMYHGDILSIHKVTFRVVGTKRLGTV